MAIDFAELAIKVKFDDVGRATVELDKMTLAGRRSQESTDGLGESHRKTSGHITDSSRAMTLLHAKAIAMNEAMSAAPKHITDASRAMTLLQEKAIAMNEAIDQTGKHVATGSKHLGFWDSIHSQAAGHVGEHSLAIGRLERALASIVGHFLGANAAVELLGSGLLKFAVGSIETAGILGGLALLATAYEKLTENARKLREEQDKLIESLNKGNYTESLGPAPDLVLEVQSQRNRVMQEESRRRLLLHFGVKPDDDRITELDRTIGYDRGQLAQGEARLTKARMDASSPLETVRTESDFFRDRRKAEEDALNASKTYWAGQTQILKEARAAIARLYETGSDYRRDNPVSDIVTNLVKDVLPQNISMPHVGLTDSMTELQKRFYALLQPFDAVGEASIKLAENLRAAKNRVSVGAQNWKPGNIGSGIESGVTGAIGDALSSFSPQAIALNLTSKAINFAVEGLTQLGASLLGVGASATEARRAQRQLTDEYNAAVASFRHDDLAAMLAQNLATYEQLLKQTNDTLGNVSTLIHGGADAFNAYKKAIADLSEQAQRNAALATQQAQEQKQYAQEDLNIRNLRATGRGDEANLLAYKERQQREYQAAVEKALSDGVLDLAERLYLQTLATTQANELIAEQNGLLSDALRNAPSGFYGVAGYVGAYATPRTPAGYPTDSGARPYTGNGGTYGGGGGTNSQQPQVIILQADGKVLARVVVNALDKYGSATNGAGSARSDALNNYPA